MTLIEGSRIHDYDGDTLRTRNHVAGGWAARGGHEPVARFEALLGGQVRVLGPDHPRTLSTRNNLRYGRDRLDRDPADPRASCPDAAHPGNTHIDQSRRSHPITTMRRAARRRRTKRGRGRRWTPHRLGGTE